jgi:hypothetical protein
MPIELSNGISDENRSINKQNGNWLKENEAIFHTIIGGGAVKIGYQEEENSSNKQ